MGFLPQPPAEPRSAVGGSPSCTGTPRRSSVPRGARSIQTLSVMPYRPPRRDRPAPPACIARRRSTLTLSAAAVFASLLAPGCTTLRQKWDAAVATDVDNPAVPQKPIRIPGVTVSEDDDPTGRQPDYELVDADDRDAGTFQTADNTDPFDQPGPDQPAPDFAAKSALPTKFDDADVVASVNGENLLAGDLLQFEVQLQAATAQIQAAPDASEDPRGLTSTQRAMLLAQVDQERVRMLAERLPAKIEEALLAQRMRRTLKAEQLEKLNAAAATLFDQTELPKMLQKANAQAAAAGKPPIGSKAELRRLMAEQGLNLDAVVTAWKPQQMAMAYVESKTGMASIRISRQEIMDYYDAHQADFTPPKAARWEQIEIPYENEAGKPAALDQVEVAAAELRKGRGFADVAKEHSRGPRADDGGRWDWTAPQAIPKERVAEAVWKQPLGQVGAVIDCPLSPNGFPPGGAYHIIRAIERRGDAPPPLEELSGRIEEIIKGERRKQAVADLLAQERAAAQIEVYVPGTEWPPEN